MDTANRAATVTVVPCSALADTRFTLRTVCNIAARAQVDEAEVADLVEAEGLTIKHRRSDGALLVGLTDWMYRAPSDGAQVDPNQ